MSLLDLGSPVSPIQRGNSNKHKQQLTLQMQSRLVGTLIAAYATPRSSRGRWGLRKTWRNQNRFCSGCGLEVQKKHSSET